MPNIILPLHTPPYLISDLGNSGFDKQNPFPFIHIKAMTGGNPANYPAYEKDYSIGAQGFGTLIFNPGNAGLSLTDTTGENFSAIYGDWVFTMPWTVTAAPPQKTYSSIVTLNIGAISSRAFRPELIAWDTTFSPAGAGGSTVGSILGNSGQQGGFGVYAYGDIPCWGRHINRASDGNFDFALFPVGNPGLTYAYGYNAAGYGNLVAQSNIGDLKTGINYIFNGNQSGDDTGMVGTIWNIQGTTFQNQGTNGIYIISFDDATFNAHAVGNANYAVPQATVYGWLFTDGLPAAYATNPFNGILMAPDWSTWRVVGFVPADSGAALELSTTTAGAPRCHIDADGVFYYARNTAETIFNSFSLDIGLPNVTIGGLTIPALALPNEWCPCFNVPIHHPEL